MKTKVFAFIFALFANFLVVNAQTDSSIYQLPAGTTLRVSMDNEINSRVAGVNDTFTMTLAAPIRAQQTILLPLGTVIEGLVTKVRRASYGGKNGSLEVSFQTLRLINGQKREIEGVLVNELNAESTPAANVLTVIGGTAIGGIIGAVSKVENGALIGAGIGAGSGTGIAFLRKGRDVSIKADEEFEIKLLKNVNLPVQDF
jgi:hypothetical protein